MPFIMKCAKCGVGFPLHKIYIVWRGEDGERWKDQYIDGEMVTYSARTVWER